MRCYDGLHRPYHCTSVCDSVAMRATPLLRNRINICEGTELPVLLLRWIQIDASTDYTGLSGSEHYAN